MSDLKAGRDHTHTVDEIIEASRHPPGGVAAFVDGRWVVAKPLHYDPLPWKVRRWFRAFIRLFVAQVAKE